MLRRKDEIAQRAFIERKGEIGRRGLIERQSIRRKNYARGIRREDAETRLPARTHEIEGALVALGRSEERFIQRKFGFGRRADVRTQLSAVFVVNAEQLRAHQLKRNLHLIRTRRQIVFRVGSGHFPVDLDIHVVIRLARARTVRSQIEVCPLGKIGLHGKPRKGAHVHPAERDGDGRGGKLKITLQPFGNARNIGDAPRDVSHVKGVPHEVPVFEKSHQQRDVRPAARRRIRGFVGAVLSVAYIRTEHERQPGVVVVGRARPVHRQRNAHDRPVRHRDGVHLHQHAVVYVAFDIIQAVAEIGQRRGGIDHVRLRTDTAVAHSA